MTILVTGGAGFIGSHLCEKLIEEGKEVVCLDGFTDFYDPEIKKGNIKNLLKKEDFFLYEGSILNDSDLKNIFDNFNIKKVVHLAALAGVRPSIEDPKEYMKVNANGTINLLEIAKDNSVKNFIFASSSSIYGENEKVPFSESDKTRNQTSPYAASKISAEAICKTYHNLYGIPTKILRLFTVYGPRQRPEMAIHKFTRQIFNDEKITLYGDGTTARDYTYVADIVDGIVAALEDDSQFEIFNLGNSETISLNKLVDVLDKNINKKIKKENTPQKPGDVSITYADIEKAKNKLGYNPKISIDEGVKKFVAWYMREMIEFDKRSISVIGGAGYVGLVTSVGLAHIGHRVTSVDVDERKIKKLRQCQSPIHEDGIEDLINENQRANRLSFTTNLEAAVKDSDFIFIAVGTPAKKDGSADLSQIEAVAGRLSKIDFENKKTIVLKSTAPVGVEDIFEKELKGKNFSIIYNPEFLREGSGLEDFFNPFRLIFGSDSKKSIEELKNIYKPFIKLGVPVVETDIKSAQLIKYTANNYLATRLSFINEISNICDLLGVNFDDVKEGVGLDPRIGSGYLNPGPGFGGPCLPKDLNAMIATSKSHGYDARFLQAVLDKNNRQIKKVVEETKKVVKKGSTVAVWGLTFKAGTDDVRNSPSMDVIKELITKGYKVRAYDPKGIKEAQREIPTINYSETPLGAAKGADLLLILVDWDEFKRQDMEEVKKKMNRANIIDFQNII